MPIIQKIETIKRNPSKSLLVFEEKSYTVSVDTIVKFACYEGEEITDANLEKILCDSLSTDLQERTINYIAYSPRTELQVRMYMQKYLKKIGIREINVNYEKMMEKIVVRLKDYSYINDRLFTELFVKSRLQNRPKSRYFLLYELLNRGINKDVANKVLDELLPENFEILKRVYEKKYGNEKLSFEDRKKIAYLQRKGFLWDDISQLINFFRQKNEKKN